MRASRSQKLGPTGKKFIKDFRAYAKIKGNMPPYSVYQAQAAQIMLGAIARSNGTRASVVKAMFRTRVNERDHGHVPLRQERRHRSEQVDQLRQAQGQAGVYEFAVVTKVGGVAGERADALE